MSSEHDAQTKPTTDSVLFEITTQDRDAQMDVDGWTLIERNEDCSVWYRKLQPAAGIQGDTQDVQYSLHAGTGGKKLGAAQTGDAETRVFLCMPTVKERKP